MLLGLILTHNLSTVIVAFFSILYVGLNFKKIKETNVKKGLIINFIFILALSCFYIGPFLETKFYSNYQVYEENMMSNPENTANHGLNINQLFVTKNDGSYVFELGPHIIIMLAFSLMAFKTIKTELKEQYVFCLFSGLISLWMATKYFPWKILPQEFSYIQFPWRMLMMTSFFFSIVCSINMSEVIKKFNYKDIAVISIISILYIIAFANILIKNVETIDNIENIELGNLSGREYEVIPGMGKGEYLPVNAYKDKFYIATREKRIYIIEGNALVQNETKNGSYFRAKIQNLNDEYAVLELPYLYYPGYEVRLDGMIVDTFETEKGFIGIFMYPNDTAELEVNYTGTLTMKISTIISFVSLIVFSIYVWKKH